MASTFRNAIEFFDKIGIYDVVLPFLLVFTIVFAILEKTKLFGTEEYDGKKYTRKNLNSMVSFVIAFLVVASSKLVQTITDISSQVVVLLLLSVFFLLLVGSFFSEGDFPVYLKEGIWRNLFMIIMFIGILFIFLHAIQRDDGEPWLEWAWDEFTNNWDTETFASVILIIVVIVFMVWIVKEPAKKSAEKKE